MNRIFSLFAALAVGLMLWSAVDGSEQDKEVTVKGKVTCAKCDLMKETKCMTVVVEKKDAKDIVYYFDEATHKKMHGEVCTASKDGAVTGTVAEKDSKKTITVKEVKYDK